MAAKSKIQSKRDSRGCFVEKTTLRRATFATERGKYAEFDFCAFQLFCSKSAPQGVPRKCKIAGKTSGFDALKTKTAPKHEKEDSFPDITKNKNKNYKNTCVL